MTDQDIQSLLRRLQALIAEIVTERAARAPLEEAIAVAWREYEDRLRPLRLEARRLEHEIATRRATGGAPASDTRTPEELAAATHPIPDRALAAPLDPEAVEKDVLLEHLVRVLDLELDASAGDVIATVQGRLDDRSVGLADLLEDLPWGPAWTGRSRKEDLAAQRHRLTTWATALQRQRDALRLAGERLRQHDPRYQLYQERARGTGSWTEYLERAARTLTEQNRELRAELDELSATEAGIADDS